MKASDVSPSIRSIAFWTILGWIALITVLILLIIWEVANSVVVTRIIWSASTITGGILLGCLTVQWFAGAGESGTAEDREDSERSDSHLHEALRRAKELPPS
ncbi:MAG: hypothetical protein KDN19_05915 [Verrucomicrobiae bacterium]|nr:hypothetical protein [Verrucomicrobiae bacterium]